MGGDWGGVLVRGRDLTIWVFGLITRVAALGAVPTRGSSSAPGDLVMVLLLGAAHGEGRGLGEGWVDERTSLGA